MPAETVMLFSGFAMVIAIAMVLWNTGRRNDRTANWWLVVTIIAFAFFAWAQIRAEKEHELKHAAEHRAVQEQVKSIQRF